MSITVLKYFTWRRILAFIVFVIFLIGCFFMGTTNRAQQARFNIDVLEKFIHAYKLVEGKQITSLADLPDFHLISTYESLSLRDEDFRHPVFKGYIYDMQYYGMGKYVLSASPIGILSPKIEFGITEEGTLRMNTSNTDPQADSYEEVEGWQSIARVRNVRTKELPAYLQN